MNEYFNSYIMETKEKLIVSMIEWIRRTLMSRIQVKRMGAKKYVSFICPRIQENLEKTKATSGKCVPFFAGESRFEVDCENKIYVVDLVAKICGCRMWDLIGIPCKHATSCISKQI